MIRRINKMATVLRLPSGVIVDVRKRKHNFPLFHVKMGDFDFATYDLTNMKFDDINPDANREHRSDIKFLRKWARKNKRGLNISWRLIRQGLSVIELTTNSSDRDPDLKRQYDEAEEMLNLLEGKEQTRNQRSGGKGRRGSRRKNQSLYPCPTIYEDDIYTYLDDIRRRALKRRRMERRWWYR